MSFSFDTELTDAVSRMRDAVGDVVKATALKQDETYEGYLRLYGVATTALEVTTAEKKATRDMLRAVAAQVGRSPSDARAGAGEGATWNHRVPTWLKLADSLDQQIAAEEATAGIGTEARLGGSLLPAGPTYTSA